MTDSGATTVLIMGLRGAGKTTLGRLLGARLSREFVDLDTVTLGVMGCRTVAQAWREQGEAGFRSAERRALEMVLERRGVVVSLGGGTPTAPGCEALLRGAADRGEAVLVYLHGQPAMLARRVANDPPEHRPRLLGLGEHEAMAEMERMYAERDPLYRTLTTRVVDAAGNPEAVLAAVLAAIDGCSPA